MHGLMQLSRKEYEDLLAVNWSSLRHMAKSAAHYREALVTPRVVTPALKRGIATHTAVYEPERLALDVARWDGDRRAGKAWQEFEAAHADKIILTADEYAQVLAMSTAVQRHHVAQRYVAKGRAEQAVTWTHTRAPIGGLPGFRLACKGRIDFIADCGAISDLKTTRDASPEAFGRAVVTYGYHAQAAFYVDGVHAATGRLLPFVFVAVEPEPPYAVIVYRVSEEILDMGREHYSALLERLALCRETNEWPGYADEEEQQLTLPPWALPRHDGDDLSDLGLTFNAANNGD